jgi:type IV pilus assembly PilO-like protein
LDGKICMQVSLSSLSPRTRVGATLGLCAVLVGVFDLLWARPAERSLADRKLAAARARTENARGREAERRLPGLRRLVRDLAAQIGPSSVLAPGVEWMRMLRDVQQRVEDEAFWITAVKPSPSAVDETREELSTALEFEGSYPGVKRFLEAVRRHPALVIVKELELRSREEAADDGTLRGKCRLSLIVPRVPMRGEDPDRPRASGHRETGVALQRVSAGEDGPQ